MIIVDTALRRREEQNRPIRVGMVGAGFMGRGLACHMVRSVPGLRLAAIASRRPATAERVCSKRASSRCARTPWPESRRPWPPAAPW